MLTSAAGPRLPLSTATKPRQRWRASSPRSPTRAWRHGAVGSSSYAAMRPSQFSSPGRDALRAAAELQAAFVAETRLDPSLPLAVGIGLDAGEAVEVGDGYRGAALNVAARLCSLASASETIATRSLRQLAGPLPGLEFVDLPPTKLKGLSRAGRRGQGRGDGRARAISAPTFGRCQPTTSATKASHRCRPSLKRSCRWPADWPSCAG